MQIGVIDSGKMNKIIPVVFYLVVFFTVDVQGELVTYPQPCSGSNCVKASPYYSVEVKQSPGNWIPSFSYFTPGHSPRADGTPDPGKSNSWTGFSFSGEVQVKVKILSGEVNSCVIRPKSRNIIPEIISGENAVVFTIREPGQFVVEFNGAYHHAMLVFANPLESYTPSESSTKLHYFGPGVHDIGLLYGDPIRSGDANNRVINEGDTIYIAGGAYLLGTISCTTNDNNYTRKKNVTIMGRGVLSGEMYTRLSHPFFEKKAHIYSLIRLGSNSKIDGITLTSPAGYSITTNDNCHINNVKTMAWYYSTDAYATGDNNITENSFSKVNDDHSKSESPRQTIRNNVYYMQVNGAMFVIGYNTNKPTVDFGANVTNCDVLHADNSYDAAVIKSVYGGGRTLTNYTFENIRIEGNCTRLFGLAVCNNAWAPQDRLYGRLTNFTFRDITLEGKGNLPGYIWGATTTDYVSNVVIDNLSVGGKIARNAKEANISVGPFVSDVFYKVDGVTVDHEKGFYLERERVALVTPTADCPVYENSPSENFGAYRNSSVPQYWLCEQFLIRELNGNSSEAFIRFEDIPDSSTYTKAYLCLFGSHKGSASTNGSIRYTLVSDDSWDETTLTWNTSRSLSLSSQKISHPFSLGLNMIDVTEMAKTQSDRKISFKLSEFSNGRYQMFESRKSLTPFMYFSNEHLTSVDHLNDRIDFKVIPNPSKDYFLIKSNDQNDIINVKLNDLAGKMIINKSVTSNEQIDISNLKNGIYLVNAYSEKGKMLGTVKLIKQ